MIQLRYVRENPPLLVGFPWCTLLDVFQEELLEQNAVFQLAKTLRTEDD